MIVATIEAGNDAIDDSPRYREDGACPIPAGFLLRLVKQTLDLEGYLIVYSAYGSPAHAHRWPI